MEPNTIRAIEQATNLGRGELFRIGTALLFVVGVMLFTYARVSGVPNAHMLVIAAIIGGYMAMNIGANDVANNVGLLWVRKR